MPKLTDTQLVILTAAAKRDDGAVLPLPKSLTLNKGAMSSVLKSLIKRDLIAERPAGLEDEPWRERGDGERFKLMITDTGLQAIGVEPDQSSEASDARPRTKRKKPCKAVVKNVKEGVGRSRNAPSALRPGTKQAMLISLLRRDQGAIIPEITEATGWQPHYADVRIMPR